MDEEELKKKFIQSIKNCKTDEELKDIIEKMYEETYEKGYHDGYGGCPEGDPDCEYPSRT
jgi:hypothetical protein